MSNHAALVSIEASDLSDIGISFFGINKTVFNGERSYEVTHFADIPEEIVNIIKYCNTGSVNTLQLRENSRWFFFPGRKDGHFRYTHIFCENQFLLCKKIVAAIAYFVEKVNFEMSTTYTYPITILYNNHVMRLNTLEDIVNFIKYEG